MPCEHCHSVPCNSHGGTSNWNLARFVKSMGTGFNCAAGRSINDVEDVKLVGTCVGLDLIGTDSGVSCNVGNFATISFTDTTLLCILGLADVIGVLVVVTLDNLAKVEGEVGTSSRLVGKTASVACWIAFDSLSLSKVLNCPVGENSGAISPPFGLPGTLLSSSLLLGVGLIPGNTQPSYS